MASYINKMNNNDNNNSTATNPITAFTKKNREGHTFENVFKNDIENEIEFKI